MVGDPLAVQAASEIGGSESKPTASQMIGRFKRLSGARDR
jgi:hypothetical protein